MRTSAAESYVPFFGYLSPMKTEKILDVYDLGNVSYRPAWDLQKSLQKLLIEQKKRLRDMEKAYLQQELTIRRGNHS